MNSFQVKEKINLNVRKNIACEYTLLFILYLRLEKIQEINNLKS